MILSQRGNPITSSASVEDVQGTSYGIKASKLPYIHELHFDISGVPQTRSIGSRC